ncbi:cAMP-regulated phosphoprotein 19-A-like [Ciona intestinalis]
MEVVQQKSEETAMETESFKVPQPPVKIEKEQEKLLAAKYGNLKSKRGTSLLQQRLANKGCKYFDSGDYNMARAEMKKQTKTAVEPNKVTGDHMPTPEELPKVRKHVPGSGLLKQ